MGVTFSAEGMPQRPEPNFGGLHDVHMNNRNAAMVSDALGGLFDEYEWWGEMPAAEFHGRVVMALALAPEDEGMPSYEHPRVDRGALIIEGARPEGYLQMRLKELHALAEWAVANNATVWWS